MALVSDLPRTDQFNYYDEPDNEKKMEFRLIYQGPLPAEKCNPVGPYGGSEGRAKEKHKLRKHFHLQLRELWKQHPNLRFQSQQRFYKYRTPKNMVSFPGPDVPMVVVAMPGDEGKPWLEHLADDHQRCGGRFVPLVREATGFTSALDILFLRRDNPGNLIDSGGDIDNRIKVLFDGLRMPKTSQELGGFSIDADEDPFFCLLEDDRLVTKVSVTTDRLIIPQRSDENVNDVLLVIAVNVSNPSALFAGDLLI